MFVSSSCSAQKALWDELVEAAGDGKLSTACVFLTAAEQGRHATDPETGKCWCFTIYGEEKSWGCEWFEKWIALVEKARSRGQIFIVFYKPGHLARVGADNTSWSPGGKLIEGELEWGELPKNGGEPDNALGGSQKAEVAWLMKNRIPFLRVDVRNGAPDADATAEMLGARAGALDLTTEVGRSEGHDVAEKLRAIGALRRALPLRRELVRAWTEARGASDDSTLSEKNNLARLLNNLSEKTEARALYDEVIAGCTTQLGPDHEKTLNAKSNLARLLRSQGDRAGVTALFSQCADGSAVAYGPSHSETEDARKQVARCGRE